MDIDIDPTPSILFLKGCFIKDCETIEDVFNDRLLHDIKTESYEPESKYNKIKTKFTSLELWPKSNNIDCWHCSCSFESIPIFIPEKITPSPDPEILYGDINVYGNFCSWCCASAHIYDTLKYKLSENIAWDMYKMLCILYFIFTNKRINHIPQSLPKTIMKKYGGKISTLEYKNMIKVYDL